MSIAGLLAGKTLPAIGAIVDSLHTSAEEKAAANVKMTQIMLEAAEVMEATVQQQIVAQKDIMVAELQQGDAYTKRARPTLVYYGLYFIAANYVLFPMIVRGSGIMAAFFHGAISPEQMAAIADASQPLQLPEEFWWAWGSAISVWSLGRDAVRSGVSGKVVDSISTVLPFNKGKVK